MNARTIGWIIVAILVVGALLWAWNTPVLSNGGL